VHEFAAPVENLDAVVRGVGYVDPADTPDGHAPRVSEPSVRRAPASETAHKTAAGGEYLDAMIERIGDDDLTR
jgi:hypothetical protein